MSSHWHRVPFAEFVADVSAAEYREYRSRPEAKVADAAAFEEMRQYLLDRYRDADVVDSYATNGLIFDCTTTQGDAVPPPSAAPPPGSAPASGDSGESAVAPNGPSCPDGTVPVARVTLEQLVRFETVDDFMAKGPGGEPPHG